MKKIISVLMILAIALGLLSGCMVRKTGSGATGEGLTPELSGELSPEITEDLTYCETEEITEDQTSEDNYQFETLDDSYLNPLTGGIIRKQGAECNERFIARCDSFSDSYEDRTPGDFESYNIVLAKILDAKEIRIHDRYYIKYKYEIEKVYDGNIAAGKVIDVIKLDLSKKQSIFGRDDVYKDYFKYQMQYPQKGQRVITEIYRESFTGNFITKDYYYGFYKNERELIKNSYIDGSSYQSMIVLEGDKVTAIGEAALSFGEVEKCETLKEAEEILKKQLKKINGNYYSLFRNPNVTVEESERLN